jgi:hypothetical protein
MSTSCPQFRRTELMSNRLRTLGEELVVIAVFGCIGLTLFFGLWF